MIIFAAQTEAQRSSAGEQLREEYVRRLQADIFQKGDVFLSPFFIGLCRRCQEKPTYESLAILFRHSAMIVQVFLQISERAFYLVVGIGHSTAFIFLICKQIWQIEVDAVFQCPKTFVREMRSAGDF